jgi:hypothetical protein
MGWEEDQKMYRRLRKKKYGPTDAVRKIREFNLRKTLKNVKRIPKQMKKGKFKGKIKTSHVKYHYNGDDEDIGMAELTAPIEPDYPETTGIDFGLSRNRRDIASEAAIRETERISNGVRGELRNTGKQLHLVQKKKKVPDRPLRNWLSRVGRTAVGGAKETYPKVRHPMRSMDAEADRRLKEMEGKYGSLTPVYVPEEDIMPPEQYEQLQQYEAEPAYPEQYAPMQTEYMRRKKGKKRKVKHKVKNIKKRHTKHTKRKKTSHRKKRRK